MIQLYSDKYGYADLGDADITINLENPYQHFFEEPEDYSYSFEVPISEQNIKFFGDKTNLISIVVDNYKVLQRFTPKILEKSLTIMKVSIYKTRIRTKPESAGTFTNWGELLLHWTSVGRGGVYSGGTGPTTSKRGSLQSTLAYDKLIFRPLGSENPHYEVECKIKKIDMLTAPVFTYVNDGDWIYGEDEKGKKVWATGKYWTRDLRTVKDKSIPYRFIELQVPYKAFLTYLLGYIPEGASDDEYIVIPVDFKNFKLNGKVVIEMSDISTGGYHRIIDAYYLPKYSTNKCYFDEVTFRAYRKENPKGWIESISPFPFGADRSNIYFKSNGTGEATMPLNYVENSNFEILHIEDIQTGDVVQGITVQTAKNSTLEIDVSGDYNMTTFDTETPAALLMFMNLDVAAMINQYYEDFAKELPVLCDYNNIPETLFHNTYWSIDSDKILSYKEKEILEEDWTIKRFGFDDYWAPYQFTSKKGDDVIMRCNDMNLIFNFKYKKTVDGKTFQNVSEHYEIPYSFGLTGYCNNIATKWNFYTDNVSLHPLRMGKDKKPVSLNTLLFWENYVQGDTNEVEVEVIGYDFSSTIHIGDRYFAVDSVETKDFKIYKLKLIEWSYE